MPKAPPECRGTAKRPTPGRADARTSDRRACFEAARLASRPPLRAQGLNLTAQRLGLAPLDARPVVVNQAAHASVAGVLPGPRFWADIVDACELLVDHRVDNPLYDPGRGTRLPQRCRLAVCGSCGHISARIRHCPTLFGTPLFCDGVCGVCAGDSRAEVLLPTLEPFLRTGNESERPALWIFLHDTVSQVLC